VVKRGQTLYRISRTYGVSVEQLTKVNHLDDPEELAAGKKLWIPGASRVLDVPITGLGDNTPVKPPAERPKPAPEPKHAEPVRVAVPEKPAPAEKKAPPPAKVAAKESPAENGSGRKDGEDETSEPSEKTTPPKEKASGTPVKTNFIWPVKGFVQSPFGQRGNRPHDGIDIKADKGSTIVAVDAGEVIYSGVQRGYGNIVLVKHSNGLITIYAHNETNDVKQGERVTKGQAIATVGRTGRATNDHLHFEVRQDRVPKNPILFLPELE
jgi:murein DD-endopeptidase MepM/ murein hydrolase activator NlpD